MKGWVSLVTLQEYDFHYKVLFPINSPLKKSNVLSLIMLKVKLIHKGTTCISPKCIIKLFKSLCNSEQYWGY